MLDEATGCLIHNRQSYESQVRELMRLAESHGWVDSDPTGTSAILDADPRDDTLDELIALADECERFLNEKVEPGFCYGWIDGEFWLMDEGWEGWE